MAEGKEYRHQNQGRHNFPGLRKIITQEHTGDGSAEDNQSRSNHKDTGADLLKKLRIEVPDILALKHLIRRYLPGLQENSHNHR